MQRNCRSRKEEAGEIEAKSTAEFYDRPNETSGHRKGQTGKTVSGQAEVSEEEGRRSTGIQGQPSRQEEQEEAGDTGPVPCTDDSFGGKLRRLYDTCRRKIAGSAGLYRLFGRKPVIVRYSVHQFIESQIPAKPSKGAAKSESLQEPCHTRGC